jgi:hypothetical protein
MSVFSGDVSRVAKTRIFARPTDHATQVLVYQMEYAAENEVALILPLPTPPGSLADAVRFLDLADYPEFFQNLRDGFAIARSAPTHDAKTANPAPLQQVESLDTFFLPSRADMTQLNSPIRIDVAVWDRLPEYHDYGFAVFQLPPGDQTLPPLALEFPMRNPNLLYFPTLELHHGTLNQDAYFDYDLFCQAHAGWMRSYDIAFAFMDIDRSKGVLTAHQRVERFTVLGMHPNSDIVINLA